MKNEIPTINTKLMKEYNAMSPRIEKGLATRYGSEFAREITQKSRIEFEEILPQVPEIPGRLNIFREIIEINAVVVAFYKALHSSGKTLDEIMETFYEIINNTHQAIPKPFRWVMGWFLTSSIFLKIAQHSSKQAGNNTEGWVIAYRKGEDAQCDFLFDATECGVLKFYEKLGVPELSVYCNFVDYIQSEAFNLGMRQTAHLGSGDVKCVECFKHGRQTKVPSNLRGLVMHSDGH